MPTPKDGSESKPTETLAQHKERVMTAAQDHAKAQKVAAQATTNRPPEGFPASPATQPSIPEFMQEMGVKPPEQPKVPEPQKPTPPSSHGEPEWQKIARENGHTWKSPEDAVRSYMNLKREFHVRMNQQRPPVQQAPPQQPVSQPSVYLQQPVYAAPPPVNLVQQLARKHGISIEDAERLLPLVAEVSEAASQNAMIQERARYEPIVVDLQKKVYQNEEMNEVANDPAMRVPRVQYEVNKLLTENQTVFQYEPQPLKWALERALRNIAIENIRADQNYSAQIPGYPTQPPVTAGTPTGTRNDSSVREPAIDLAGNYFKLKTAAEKREFLVAMGVPAE